jgi:hypothetical protein
VRGTPRAITAAPPMSIPRRPRSWSAATSIRSAPE